MLLKLKQKENVSSADETKPNAAEMKKKLNKKLLLENYVDFM